MCLTVVCIYSNKIFLYASLPQFTIRSIEARLGLLPHLHNTHKVLLLLHLRHHLINLMEVLLPRLVTNLLDIVTHGRIDRNRDRTQDRQWGARTRTIKRKTLQMSRPVLIMVAGTAHDEKQKRRKQPCLSCRT